MDHLVLELVSQMETQNKLTFLSLILSEVTLFDSKQKDTYNKLTYFLYSTDESQRIFSLLCPAKRCYIPNQLSFSTFLV